MFKSNSQEFSNKTVGLFSGNDTIIAVYLVGIHRDMWMKTFFNPPYFLQKSTVVLQIKNSPNQIGTFMIISCGKGAIYFSRLFFFVL